MQTMDILTKLVPTMFLMSSVPGLCMTLAMSLEITIGFKRTLWMMVGELTGVSVIVTFIAAGASHFF